MNTTQSNQESSSPLSHKQFMRLFLQSKRELLRYVMAIVLNVNDARDIVQETAVTLWQGIEKYDTTRPFVPRASRFALNEAWQHLRAAGRRKRFLAEDVAALLESRRMESAQRLDARREYLRDCLGRLPAEQQDLVRGYYVAPLPGKGNILLQESIETSSVPLTAGSVSQRLKPCHERRKRR